MGSICSFVTLFAAINAVHALYTICNSVLFVYIVHHYEA
jgi:hypothetical protein